MNLIFDLDGTLIDSSSSIEKAFECVVKQFNIMLPTDFIITSIIGNPLYDTLFSLTADARMSEKALVTFRNVYKDQFILNYTLYPQVSQFMELAKKNGHHLFVVTNKAKPLAEIILQDACLQHYFSGIYGPGFHASVKKEQLLKQLLCEHRQVNSRNSLFIGDTYNDLEAASALDIETIILLHGYGNKADFDGKLVKLYCENFAELHLYFSENTYAAV